MAPLRILLIKPYQPQPVMTHVPPLGLLYLTSNLRRRFAQAVSIQVIDAKMENRDAEGLRDDLAAADVVGLSAFNFEMEAAFAIARVAKALDPAKLVVLGGPLVHNRAEEVLTLCPEADWAFDGEAERTFPEAIGRHLAGQTPDGTIPGMFFRDGGRVVAPPGNDFIADINALPWPAWDFVDFAAYAAEPSINFLTWGRRYATLFTSRGCPYKCNYCHDLFTKKFRWRSAEDVVAEISFLVDHHGVEEFQIIDDIFNLHKPRVKRIFALLKERYPDKRLYFCFPNGLRGDILDRETVQAMKDGGAYQATVAIETVTERLQELTEKHLDVEKARRAIEYFDEAGIVVTGFFMLGFPTETTREIWDTIRFALRSRLAFAHFFTVVPQPGTPLYDIALRESPEATRRLGRTDYYGLVWYKLATGYPLRSVAFLAYLLFHLHPRRFYRLIKHLGFARAVYAFGQLLTMMIGFNPFGVGRGRRRGTRLPAPEAILPEAVRTLSVAPRAEVG